MSELPELICYVPFPPTGGSIESGDLRANAKELTGAKPSMPSTRTGKGLNDRRIVFWGQEAQNEINAEDVVVVCAHGAPDDTELSDNAGNWRTQAEVLAGLDQLGARNASEVHFFACYSKLDGHIGPTFKAANSGVQVFATKDKAEGALIGTTRSGLITHAIWTADKKGRGQLDPV